MNGSEIWAATRAASMGSACPATWCSSCCCCYLWQRRTGATTVHRSRAAYCYGCTKPPASGRRRP
ncbi:Hypothetical predicted protein [Olea europaea subsp. europaea]|uniref:Uncharacterized protein n=1 Tax=Olea europaea subsp. europaea TaxID=158383 RepID=A0A8S0R1P1_OLEEU|nr:Hypothetical predicted protein [Olea europaea subsp. europaea]